MLEIIIDVDNGALRVLTENLQTFWMKDVSGEIVKTVVSYLKGALILLLNYGKVPMCGLGILRNIFYSVEYDGITIFMGSTHFEHKHQTNMTNFREYLTLTKSEYRMLYRKGSWSASEPNPASGFYAM